MGGLVVLATGHNPLLAYRDIFNGAGLNWIFHPTTNVVNTSAYNLSQTLLQTTTLILCGLAVAFAFRCGMFNIGGQGQYIVGLIVANWLGSDFAGMSPLPHILLVIVAGAASGRAVGRHRRLPQGGRRRPRGDLDDHAQLDRDLGRARGSSATAGSCRTRRTRACRSRATSPTPPSCRSSGASRSCKGSTSASSSLLLRSSSSSSSSTGRRSATRCARSASTPRRPRTAAST